MGHFLMCSIILCRVQHQSRGAGTAGGSGMDMKGSGIGKDQDKVCFKFCCHQATPGVLVMKSVGMNHSSPGD